MQVELVKLTDEQKTILSMLKDGCSYYEISRSLCADRTFGYIEKEKTKLVTEGYISLDEIHEAKKARNKRLRDELDDKVYELLTAGESKEGIKHRLQLSSSALYNCLKRLKNSGRILKTENDSKERIS